MEKELPIYDIDGMAFSVDVQQLRLIEKANPQNYLPFSEMDQKKSGYFILFDRERRVITDDYEKGNCLTVRIPWMTQLDPLGMAEKYNVPFEGISTRTDRDVLCNNPEIDARIKNGQLNIYEIKCHPFYVDFPMGVLRPKDDFSTEGISLDILDYDDFPDMEGTFQFYDEARHEIMDLDWSGWTVLPTGISIIHFPKIMDLNPVGFARKFNNDLFDVLLQVNHQPVMKAREVTVEECGLSKTFEANKSKILEAKPKANRKRM